MVSSKIYTGRIFEMWWHVCRVLQHSLAQKFQSKLQLVCALCASQRFALPLLGREMQEVWA